MKNLRSALAAVSVTAVAITGYYLVNESSHDVQLSNVAASPTTPASSPNQTPPVATSQTPIPTAHATSPTLSPSAAPPPITKPTGGAEIKQIPGPEPELGTIPIVRTESDIKLPLDKYRLTPAELDRRNVLWARLEQDCMRRYGLDGIVGRQFNPTRQSAITDFLDPLKARVSGYVTSQSEKPDVLNSRENRVTDAEQGQAAATVYVGSVENYNGLQVPKGGCLRETRDKIVPRVDEIKIDVSELVFAAGISTQSDSRVTAARSAWSSCMKDLGFAFTSPKQARVVGIEKSSSSKSEEIRIATADVGCREKTNLTGIQTAVEAAYQERLLTANLDLVLAAKKYTDETLSRVQKLGG